MPRLRSTLPADQQNPQTAITPERVQRLIDLYKKNNVEYPWKEEDKQEQIFEFRRSRRPNTYRYTIHAIYRVRDPSDRSKEYYFYQKEGTCLNDNDGTERSGTLMYGFTVEPVHEIKYNDQLRAMAPRKLRDDPVYFYKWDRKEVQKLLDGSEVPCFNFYFGIADRRGQVTAGINNIRGIQNQDDFINATFDQLTIINKRSLGDANTPALHLVKKAEEELEREEMRKIKQETSQQQPMASRS